MAEEKKPKIDLKARLGKASAGVTPPPGVAGPVPVPVPPPQLGSRPPPPVAPTGQGIPVGPPPTFGSGAPPIDPSNPLAAVAAPYRPPPSVPVQPPQAQRIEIDEVAVQQARGGARKQGLIMGLIAGALFAVVGYVAGGASQQGADRTKSKNDATELAGDVGKAKETLTKLADKLEAGRNMLLKDHKFPDQLANDLGGINVDFDGTKLAGRRFSGFPTETTGDLVAFITEVQTLNDRKAVVKGLLTKLQKPLSEQLNAPQGQTTIAQVVVIDKDPLGNVSALLAPLATPITFVPPKLDLPGKFTFANPIGSGNAELPAYKAGDISKNPGAIYVAPKTFDKVCPSETSSQTAQLAAQIGNVLRDIRGEQQAQQTDIIVNDEKPGLLQRADKLIAGLGKVK